MPDRTVPVAAVFLAAMAAAQARAAAPSTAVPPAVLDLALEPVPANTRPGPAYTAAALDYAMVLGIDRTPKGRLWAAWIAGGDSEKGLVAVASSDDGGATWTEPRMVVDPSDAPPPPTPSPSAPVSTSTASTAGGCSSAWTAATERCSGRRRSAADRSTASTARTATPAPRRSPTERTCGSASWTSPTSWPPATTSTARRSGAGAPGASSASTATPARPSCTAIC